MRARLLLAPVLIAAASPAAAEPLTIRPGETWVFMIERGEPAKARRANASATPAKGQIKATLTAIMGTTLTVTNYGSVAYRYRAELLGAAGKPAGERTCTLPANAKPTLEYWPAKADAVRLSNFRPAPSGGNCP